MVQQQQQGPYQYSQQQQQPYGYGQQQSYAYGQQQGYYGQPPKPGGMGGTAASGALGAW